MTADSMLQVHQFHPADYVVFISMLLISLLIGFYYAFTGGRQATVQEYLLGNRQMGILPIAMSLLASFISAVSMIGTPTEIYMYGLGGFYLTIGTLIALPIVSSCFLPTFYNIGLTSVYEYIELRFDKNVRKTGCILLICYLTVYGSYVLYAPALSLSQVTGLNLWFSVAVIGILATVYTCLGGIKAVMWTDVFQICIMVLSLCVIAFKGVFDLGGFSYVFNRAAEGKRLVTPSWDFDFRIRYTVWNVTVASAVQWISMYGTHQIQVQRYLSSPTLKAAKWTIMWNMLGMIIFNILLGICGLNIYGKYWDCDPTAGKLVKAYDQVFPLFVMETLKDLPSLPGLFVAGIFCGTLSSLSSAFNSMAAITLEDLVKGFNKWKHLSTQKSVRLSKILAASYGCLCVLVVVAISQSDSNLMQATRYNLGVFNGTALGLFVLGLFIPWANRWGAYVGVVLGFSFSLWVSINIQMKRRPFTPRSPYSVDGCEAMYGYNRSIFNITTEEPLDYTTPSLTHSTYNTSTLPETEDDVFVLFQMSFMWIYLLSSCSVVIIGLVTSLLTGPTKLENLDVRLLSPIVQKLVKKYLNRKGFKPEPSSVQCKDGVPEVTDNLHTPALSEDEKENEVRL